MEIRAHASYLPISAQKIRLVCDQVRGMDAEQAVVVLKFMPQKGAELVGKLLASAIANAENNHDLNRTDLVISHISADQGPAQRRVKAGARGRYKPRSKRTAHVTLILSNYVDKE